MVLASLLCTWGYLLHFVYGTAQGLVVQKMIGTKLLRIKSQENFSFKYSFKMTSFEQLGLEVSQEKMSTPNLGFPLV